MTESEQAPAASAGATGHAARRRRAGVAWTGWTSSRSRSTWQVFESAHTELRGALAERRRPRRACPPDASLTEPSCRAACGWTPSWYAVDSPARVSTPPSWSPTGGCGSPGASRPSRPPASPPTSPSWCARTRTRPDYVSRGGHKLAGALAAFEPAGPRGARAGAASTPGRRPAGSPTSCCGPAPRRWSRSTSATASWPGRCAPTSGCVVHDRTNVRDLTPDLVGGPVDLVVGDLSFISLDPGARRAARRRARGRRPGADGQAAVRGRQGPGRQGRRGARPRAARRGGHRRGRDRARGAAGVPGPWPPARCRGRRATWSSSCGCGAGRPRSATDEIAAEVAAVRTPARPCGRRGSTVPGEKVDP